MLGRGARDLGPEAWRESPFGYLAGVCWATGSYRQNASLAEAG